VTADFGPARALGLVIVTGKSGQKPVQKDVSKMGPETGSGIVSQIDAEVEAQVGHQNTGS
jgi:hypothetical protein